MSIQTSANSEIPKSVRFALFGGGVMALAGTGVIGTDLLSGLKEGIFYLTKYPVTAAESGSRFQLVAFGEGFAVLVLLALGAALITAAFLIGHRLNSNDKRK